MLPVVAIQAENFEAYTCFFTKLPGQPKNKQATVKPAGKYIRAFSKGGWDNLPLAYHRILDFVNTNKLILKGYAYEEGLNEMALSSMDEYVT